MTTALITHSDCLAHVNPQGHPEQVARLERILIALEGKSLQRIEAPLAAEEDLLRVHPASYLETVRGGIPEKGWAQMDGDTFMSPGSLTAARRAVGGVVHAVDLVLGANTQNAFVACRPPGHHAETSTAMGFCLFGNVAIGAKYALERHGLSRVAVVDFDVHHGNGTQDMLWNEPRILFCSSHQMPLFPGSGYAHETGAHGNILNVPFADGTGSAKFHEVLGNVILRAVDDFKPELILVSAGFDAHAADPLAGMRLTDEDFAWVTEKLCDLADTHCEGRLISSLEGGYDLAALASSVAAHVDVLIARGAQ